MRSAVQRYFDDVISQINIADEDQIQTACEMIGTVSSSGRRIYIIGNGGSAAIASHVAVDLTKACKCPTQAFHDPALLTCYTNDYGYEHGHETMVSDFVAAGDLCVFISSSGTSENIINAAFKAREVTQKSLH